METDRAPGAGRGQPNINTEELWVVLSPWASWDIFTSRARSACACLRWAIQGQRRFLWPAVARRQYQFLWEEAVDDQKGART